MTESTRRLEPSPPSPEPPSAPKIVDEDGPIRLGSDGHLLLFCHMLLGSFDPYRPEDIAWPPLNEEARERLTTLPIWDLAVQTEGNAAVRMQSYAESVSEPLLKRAVALNAFEEFRHKSVLAHLVAFYGIPLQAEPTYDAPRWPEGAYLRTGLSECIDSFLAFGLFATARDSGYFPEALVATFEPVIQEECRHILFFANWLDWHRRNLTWHRRLFFELRCLWTFGTIFRERIRLRGRLGNSPSDNQGVMRAARQSLAIDLDFPRLLRLCLDENDRRMSRYDPRLVRPWMMPTLARLILWWMDRGR